MISMNSVIEAIKNRRSISSFKPSSIEDAELYSILDAGRWAPSHSNIQPWEFIVVKDVNIKNQLYDAVKEKARLFADSVKQAAVVIITIVDASVDKTHYVEAGAIATQNMALAAYSLKLGSSWIGVHNSDGESDIKEILDIPKKFRVISLLPIGTPDNIPLRKRKEKDETIHYEKYRIKAEKEIRPLDEKAVIPNKVY